ncbi:hypothetical protein PchlO6_3589 [Pseudomonas chlororaphis O6]|uniref:Uncharacterized protein n=1 Tax=Pseudomonas chlororaphis O6 TaxID=1037915 RepID=A0AB33WP24_9PSED|nr:hypothetical protein PchlO6_3589 [Pseudomonas chlororaphis O6]
MLNGQQLVRVGANLSGITPGDLVAPLNNPSLKSPEERCGSVSLLSLRLADRAFAVWPLACLFDFAGPWG